MIRLALLIGVWLAASAAQATPVRVSAASSLGPVLEVAAQAYAEDVGGPAPVITLGASSRLARQLEQGASADLVAMADPAWMDRLVAKGIVDAASRVDFLGNRLVVAVPAGRKAAGLSDAAQWERFAIPGPVVPLGQYARSALASAGLLETVRPRFVLTANARATATIIAQGEVDAGIVYQTDTVGDARLVPTELLPGHAHRPIWYPLALTEGAGSQARQFLDYLTSADAQEAFARAGFIPMSGAEPAPVIEAPTLQPVPAGPPLLRSLWVAVLSLVLSLIPAIGLGWLMARRSFVGKSLLSTVLLSPLVLPPVVTGYLLLQLFGHSGWLAPLGLQLAFTRWGAVVAASVVGFPLLLILVRQAIESVDERYPAIAQTLGLKPWQAFWRITLPMALPGIAAGAVLAFARALGEFGATAMLAGDQPGETRTLALAVYALVEQPGGDTAAVTLVWASLGVCFLALLAYERLVWRQQRQAGRRS